MTEPAPDARSGYHLDRDERGLTARQRDVLKCVVDGKTARQIEADLGMTRQRVSAIVKQLVDKGLVERTGHGKPLRLIAGPPPVTPSE